MSIKRLYKVTDWSFNAPHYVIAKDINDVLYQMRKYYEDNGYNQSEEILKIKSIELVDNNILGL